MKQNHIIQRVFIEITVDKKEKAFTIKDDINSFLTIDVFPKLEKYINALEDKFPNQTIQVPRLELNLDVKNSSLTADLKDRIVKLFKKELSEITKPILKPSLETESDTNIHLIDNQEKMLQTFIHFLEKGYMPWWNSGENGIPLLESKAFNSIILAENFQKSIAPVLSKQNVQNRMINQLSNDQITLICQTIIKNNGLEINLESDSVYHLSKLSRADRNTFWSLLLTVLSEYLNHPNDNLKEYIVQQIVKLDVLRSSQIKEDNQISQNWKEISTIFPFIKENEVVEKIKDKSRKHSDEAKETTIESDLQENTITNKDLSENDGQYVQNAGLILIHPFIKTLFKHCNLIHAETQQLTDPELCAHLLHYIATGETNPPEYNMIFEKFMCNIPLSQSINRHVTLSRKHKTQAKNVIEAVQQNWSSMKKSSVELLQNEFFQRSGKLTITDYDYVLTVERKTQDILLDKLAWGIGFVKLPWQEKFIHVNW